MGRYGAAASQQGSCVIMAGGKGTRFWPLSRARRPKQLLALGSNQTLLRETFERVLPLVGPERILIITNETLASDVVRQLPELPAERVIGEPFGRNTAPCAMLGIGLTEAVTGPGPVALLPADHWIPDGDLFRRQLATSFRFAAETGLPVTFGISPTRPETGYGYLESDAATASAGADDRSWPEFQTGLRFVEKPDAATAETYLATGRFFWNSGMFVWDSRAFATASADHLPEVAELLQKPLAAFGTSQFAGLLRDAYAGCPAVSIDVGVMEKLSAFAVLPAAFRWSDIGSWDVWGELAPELADRNRGRAELHQLDSRGNVIYAPDRTVALIGVDDLIVVDTSDALLICRKDEAQRIRDLTSRLEAQDRDDLL